jgi:hypothetical protein
MVKMYSFVASLELLVMVILSVAFLYGLYSPNGLDQCHDLVKNTPVTCPQLTTARKVGATIITVVILIIQICTSPLRSSLFHPMFGVCS